MEPTGDPLLPKPITCARQRSWAPESELFPFPCARQRPLARVVAGTVAGTASCSVREIDLTRVLAGPDKLRKSLGIEADNDVVSEGNERHAGSGSARQLSPLAQRVDVFRNIELFVVAVVLV